MQHVRCDCKAFDGRMLGWLTLLVECYKALGNGLSDGCTAHEMSTADGRADSDNLPFQGICGP